MSSTPLTSSATAARIWKLLRGVFGSELPVAIDLEVVRELLNQPAFGKGANLKKPIAFDAENFEGALVRNEDQHEEWGIFYKPRPKFPERERFTIAHEMGHFVLHRGQQRKFNCDKESVYSGIDTIRAIEREADDFASNLLMPGDLLRDWIAKQRIDFRFLGDIAQRFQVSLEALCIRYIKFTTERAILVYWDNGYMKYEWRSSSAVKTRARTLTAPHGRIDQHFEQLRGWAEHMDQARRLAAEFAQSDAFRDLVIHGIAPDGSVDWPAAGIVRALRDAAAELAVDGWTPVASAGRWIAERLPEHLPTKYGCSSWRQVIHESRLFELRYRDVGGQRAAWYRAKQN